MHNSGHEYQGRHQRRGHVIKNNPERGWTQFLFLRLIHEKPMHGYQIMEELSSRGFLQENRLEAGSVYTILRRMEHHGLITSVWEEKASGPDRRVYTISTEGSEILKSGLEIMLKRKALLDDLAEYYKQKFQSKEG
ncbi:PadR family transcriptional regulator [Candidatus Bathyarchaeota archaeon]|nr:PadR family transcriptional regulator [Candidatus Bathyarchaeota archaeon]